MEEVDMTRGARCPTCGHVFVDNMQPERCLRCGYVDFYYLARYSFSHELAVADRRVLKDRGDIKHIISEEEHERRKLKGLE